MLLNVTSFRVFAGLTAAQLALAETVLRHSAWHDPLVGSVFGLLLGMALFGKRMHRTSDDSDVQPYQLTA